MPKDNQPAGEKHLQKKSFSLVHPLPQEILASISMFLDVRAFKAMRAVSNVYSKLAIFL